MAGMTMRRKKLPKSRVRDQKSILKACRWHRVSYHHHDAWPKPAYGPEMRDLQNAVVVVYSSTYGNWQLAINEDGSISRPWDEMRRLLRNAIRRLRMAFLPASRVPALKVAKGPKTKKSKEARHD